MIRSACYYESDYAADRAGYEHRSHDYASHIHSRVFGSVFAIAYNRYFVALLGVLHVYVHGGGYKQDYDPAGMNAEHIGEPCAAFEHWNYLRAFSAFPWSALQIGDYSYGDIVHHEGEQCFIGVVLRFEVGGYERPDSACDRG